MKKSLILKSCAFVLAAVMLICTVASAAGLVVCLAFGAYSDGKGALTRNLNDNILSDFAYDVEAYLFDDLKSLRQAFEGTGIQAKITNPDGSLHLIVGEEDAQAGGYSITFKCVYLENYEYEINRGSMKFYYVDTDGEMKRLPSDSDIYYITPDKMTHLLEAGGKIVSPNPNVPVSPETLPSYPHRDETYPPVATEGDTVTDMPDTQPPEETPELYPYRPLEDNYVILKNGAYSPVYASTEPEMNYFTGSYIYSRDGEFGYIGNVFPDEIENTAYTVKLTMTEAYHAQSPGDYEYIVLDFMGDNMYHFVWLTPLLLILTILLLIYLASAAGHTKNGLRESWIEKIPTDLYLAICAIICLIPLYLDVEHLIFAADDIYSVGAIVGTMAVIYAVIFVGVIMSLALRIKTKKIFSYTLVAIAVKYVWVGIKFLFRALAFLCKNIGTLWTNVLGAVIFFFWTIALSVACSHYYFDGPVILLLIFGLAVFPAIFIYVGYQQNKINRVCKKIGDGQVDSKVDTKYMTPNHRSQAETVNRIGSGLSAALTERMKSERLKTELITNVSHDLKTPLTSIVNYADLLSREQESENPDSEKIREYTNVISRQSARLKKLTEDLVEASKASTGNVESCPEVLDVSELLSQSVGEFADRFEAAGLTPVESKPGTPVQIFADGRHLWRIFENLLVNTCKYSMPGTRVYIDLSEKGENVTVTIKNISSQPLNISPDELTERFVRGDSSRHTEGSGLGLSIAKSLAELQGGSLTLDIDGDCFKAILNFKKA